MTAQRKRHIRIAIGTVIVGGALATLAFYANQRSKDLRVTFFDVGQGDSIFVQTPSGDSILVDGGPDAGVLPKIGNALPFYDHTIDLVVLTHEHADHACGLVDVLERYAVRALLYEDAGSESPCVVALREMVREKNIPVVEPHGGQAFTFGLTSIHVLFPEVNNEQAKPKNLNAMSIVVRVSYQNTSFLLTGDAPTEVEKVLVEKNNSALGSDVLKVGHHGSRYSSSEEFLETIDPEYAIISVGAGNSYGHPHRSVIMLLQKFGMRTFRTDEVGDIRMVSDGTAVRILP
ncbi:MAG: MBL fold metallo-hydrolase [Patescibacteria group bacterium]|nr:MBL fold metallo-hydrolase [Patescibacteria group bacterium]MDD5715692.1 MBL fold metallo-hydrolase [Patescibacteria group bacterium]